jgi:hypothetical protein
MIKTKSRILEHVMESITKQLTMITTKKGSGNVVMENMLNLRHQKNKTNRGFQQVGY